MTFCVPINLNLILIPKPFFLDVGVIDLPIGPLIYHPMLPSFGAIEKVMASKPPNTPWLSTYICTHFLKKNKIQRTSCGRLDHISCDSHSNLYKKSKEPA
jgi:hypothetical protein